jgi:PEP-CTERM motif
MKARLLCAAASAAVMAGCVMPVGASAAIVSVAPPEYYAEAGAIGGIWSDSPESVSFDGPPYGAFAGSSAGVAGVNFVAGGPGAVTTDPITAEMRYVFTPLGTPGAHVLVHVEFAGYAFAKTVLVDDATSAAAYASAEGTVNGHATIFCASIPTDGCPKSPGVSKPAPVGSALDALSYDTTSFYAIAGEGYLVDLLATANGGIGCEGCEAIGNAKIDPYIWIDPSQADQFSLLISAGVPNVPFPTAVPEPSTWVMMLIGFAGLAYPATRRKGDAIAA